MRQQRIETAAVQPPPTLMVCAGCGRGIPSGYLATATKWKSVDYGTTSQALRMQKATELHCQQCAGAIEGRPTYRRKVSPPPGHALSSPVPEATGLSMKELALKIYPYLDGEQGTTSKRLAAKIGHANDEEVRNKIKTVLDKLRDAGKVEKKEGEWYLA